MRLIDSDLDIADGITHPQLNHLSQCVSLVQFFQCNYV
jgi:hypothetical protein